MADIIDQMQERDAVLDLLKAPKNLELPAGEPGECRRCGEDSLRLINSTCAPCRDKYKLP